MADRTEVRTMKTMLILLLALAWVPLNSHCLLESVPGFEFLICSTDQTDEDTSSSDPCSDGGCCSVESAKYFSAWKPVTIPAGTEILAALPPARQWAFDSLSLHAQTLGPWPNTSPPVIPASWQFALRTALPARAPSLAS